MSYIKRYLEDLMEIKAKGGKDMINSGYYIDDEHKVLLEEATEEQQKEYFDKLNREDLIGLIKDLLEVISIEYDNQYQEYLTQQEMNDY